MLKRFGNLRGLGSSAKTQQNSTLNIHTAFKLWIENHAEYKNLIFQYGNQLFTRDSRGVYVTQVSRIAFEAFMLDRKFDRTRLHLAIFAACMLGIALTVAGLCAYA